MDIENTHLYKNSKTVPATALDKLEINNVNNIKQIIERIGELTLISIDNKHVYEFFLSRYRNYEYFDLLNKSILIEDNIIESNNNIKDLIRFKAYNQAFLEKMIAYNLINKK